MRPFLVLFLSAAGLLAQTPQPSSMRYQPTYEDLKSALGLTDDQVTQLTQMQKDKMAATQAFYSKMAEKQKELNALLESSSSDATHVGQLMLDLQQLRKQQPPGAMDIHERAVGILSAEQKQKLDKLAEAQKLRPAVDQGLQLALLSPPPPTPAPVVRGPSPAPGPLRPMTTQKPPSAPK